MRARRGALTHRQAVILLLARQSLRRDLNPGLLLLCPHLNVVNQPTIRLAHQPEEMIHPVTFADNSNEWRPHTDVIFHREIE